MTTRRPKKTRAGGALKEMARTAKIRAQLDDERERHRAAMTDLSLRRQKAVRRIDQIDRTIELQRISNKEMDERRRHQAKMDSLQKRIFSKT